MEPRRSHGKGRPYRFRFEQNGELYCIGSDVGNYLKVFRRNLYKKYPGLTRRTLTTEERKRLFDIGLGKYATVSQVILLLASEVDEIIDGNEDPYKRVGPEANDALDIFDESRPSKIQLPKEPKTRQTGHHHLGGQGVSYSIHLDPVPQATQISRVRPDKQKRRMFPLYIDDLDPRAVDENALKPEELIPAEDPGAASDDSDTFNPHTPSRYNYKNWRSFLKDRNKIKKEAVSLEDIVSTKSCGDGDAVKLSERPIEEPVLNIPPSPSQTVSNDEDDDNTLSACMFGGGHKRNLRDRESSDSPDKGNSSRIAVPDSLSSEKLGSYQRGPKRIKLLASPGPDISGGSNSTNNDEEMNGVHSEAGDSELGDPEEWGREETVWNEEFEGCFVVRCRTETTVLGVVKMNGNTIRPFGRVEAKEPMYIVVLRGEVVVKTIPISNPNEDLDSPWQSLTRKVGEWTTLPSGIAFSLENRTDSIVEMCFSCCDG